VIAPLIVILAILAVEFACRASMIVQMPADKSIPPGHQPFVRAIARALRRRCGVREGARIVVAVSGGCDSLALLRAMALLAKRRKWRLELAVGHVQHHLREQAEGDASLVEALANELDLPFMRADLSLPRGKHNLEAVARHQRYEALRTMAETFDARYVATAHQADDQLETLLMRLLRGASIAGLRGMAWQRRLTRPQAMDAPILIRPMLSVTRDDAAAFLALLHQPWREDHTNADVSRLRARLRHAVLPVLREIRSDAAHKAVILTDHLRAIHELVEAEIDRHHERVSHENGRWLIDRGEARLMNRAVLVALLRRVLTEAGVGRDRLGMRTLGPVVRAIGDTRGGERSFSLSDGVRIAVTREAVRIGRM
jgi:tRNA(Ile)-lysidine synthetase-like protein